MILATLLRDLEGEGLSSSQLGLAALALLLATFGAVTASALLIYSPTKLARDESGSRLEEHLDAFSSEYQVVARLLMIGVQARPVKSGSGTAPGRPGDQGARRHRATSEGSARGGTHGTPGTLAHRSPTVRPST